MNEDVYVLKDAVDNAVLAKLNYAGNFKADRFNHAASEHVFTSIDEIRDWTNALESGKQIVNPVTPQEELRRYYNNLLSETAEGQKNCKYEQGIMVGIDTALRSVSQVHPDVKKWLREGEADG